MPAFKRRGHLSAFFMRLLVAAFAASTTVPCLAGTACYWTGTVGSGNWSDSGNWSCSGSCPASGSNDSVYFLSAGIYDPGPSNNLSGTFSLSSLTFNSGAAPVSLAGNPISFNMASTGGGIYQNSANPVTIENALSWMGSNTLTFNSQGAGGLTLAGSLSSGTGNGLVDVSGGAVTFSTGSFVTGTNGSLRVGDNSPASLTIQNGAVVSVGGELDVNYQNTIGGVSTLTLNSGSLAVGGSNPMIIGRASLRTGPSSTSAAFYQTGGSTSLGGLLTVGYNGTATSLLDIDAGTLYANGGLVVGDGAVGRAGNGSVNIHGSGVVNVSGSTGLVIGQNSALTTNGNLTLSSGTLNVTGNLMLTNSGGIGSFTRSGGSLSVTGNLVVGGVATLGIDDTSMPVPTPFGGLSRSGSGTLVIVPQNGQLSGNEQVTFANAPSITHGIIGSWLVAQASGSDSSGTYLTCSGSLTTPVYTSFSGSHTTATNELSDVTGAATITGSGNPWALRVGPYTAMLTNTLTLGSGGLILNGGTANGGMITGGTLALGGVQGLFYAGSSNPAMSGGTIQSPISGSDGFQKFGLSSLVLSGNNAGLSGAVTAGSGTLRLASSAALGNGPAIVAGGAAMELYSTVGITVANSLTLAGNGVGGNGALRNVSGSNSMGGTISLANDAQFNVDGGLLTLTGAVAGPGYNLTKAGSGTLVLAGSSPSFPGTFAIANGTVQIQSSSALGVLGSSLTVVSGATVQLQKGITMPGGASLNLSGAGGGNGALENVQGTDVWPGTIALAADSMVGVDSAADTLVLSGPISGNSTLTKSGPGILQLASTASSFTGGLGIMAGTLQLSSINAAGSNGQLGAGLLPVTLGSSGNAATLFYTGPSASTNRAFTLAANATGQFVVSQATNLTLNGPVGGNGNLSETGGGTLTLAGADTYTGTTTVSSGTLVVSGSGSLASTSINVVAANFTIYNASGASIGNRIANNATLNLTGGTISFSNDGSAGNFNETLGCLNLAGGDSIVNTAPAGAGGTSTLTLSGISASLGTLVSFTGSGLGASACNAISITGQVTGFLGGYATSGNDWVKYAQIGSTGVYSVMSFSASDYETRGDPYWTAAYWPTGVFPKLTGGTTTLSTTTDRTIGSLNVAASSAVTLDIPDGRTLHIDGGTACGSDVAGILISGSSATTIAASGTDQTGAITAGLANQPGELLIQQDSSASAVIGASISDNGGAAYPVTLVKKGPGTLILSGSNTYTGGTFALEGVLNVASGEAIPPGTSLTVSCTAIFDSGLAAGAGSPVEVSRALQSSIATVPEPSALALLAAGCVALAVIVVQPFGVRRGHRRAALVVAALADFQPFHENRAYGEYNHNDRNQEQEKQR